MLLKTLTNNGLTHKEATVYLATLELGASPASAIAASSKLNRVTTYDTLKRLIQKGLVSYITKSGVKIFTATDPELVVSDARKRTQQLASALPELKRLHGSSPHPKVQYYEGIDGIKNIYADTLTSTTPILNYCNSKEIRQFWPHYDDEYVQERAAKKIYLRGIAPDDEYGRIAQNHDPEYYREIRLIPEDQYNFTNEIHIYNDKVAIISLKNELIGMIIESSEIANTQRAIFQMVWDFQSKKL